ncbi:hypothetical protein TNCV_1393441 [Trichonephila clavipes]|nr:hypothetical protein TNCV_1393441 [Trichonephila clavipes]
MFTRRPRLPVGLTPVQIFGQLVPWVHVAKYLGLFLDAKLTFAHHIEQTRKKAQAVHAVLKRLISRRSKLAIRQKLAIPSSTPRVAELTFFRSNVHRGRNPGGFQLCGVHALAFLFSHQMEARNYLYNRLKKRQLTHQLTVRKGVWIGGSSMRGETGRGKESSSIDDVASGGC